MTQSVSESSVGERRIANLKTRPFKLTRTQLAYTASEEFLRSFWWIAGTIPAFGLILLIFGSGLMQAMGLFAIAWPFSIPARGILATSKSSKLFMAGCYATIDDQNLTFYEDTAAPIIKRWQIPLWRIRDVVERRDLLLVRTRKLEFIPIPLSAFDNDQDKAIFIRTIAHAIETRLSEG